MEQIFWFLSVKGAIILHKVWKRKRQVKGPYDYPSCGHGWSCLCLWCVPLGSMKPELWEIWFWWPYAHWEVTQRLQYHFPQHFSPLATETNSQPLLTLSPFTPVMAVILNNKTTFFSFNIHGSSSFSPGLCHDLIPGLLPSAQASAAALRPETNFLASILCRVQFVFSRILPDNMLMRDKIQPHNSEDSRTSTYLSWRWVSTLLLTSCVIWQSCPNVAVPRSSPYEKWDKYCYLLPRIVMSIQLIHSIRVSWDAEYCIFHFYFFLRIFIMIPFCLLVYLCLQIKTGIVLFGSPLFVKQIYHAMKNEFIGMVDNF